MDKAEVLIDPITYADIFLAADLCPVEVSGLAKVKREGDKFLIFGEAIIFEQNCRSDGMSTEFDPEAHGKWIHEMIQSGRQEEVGQARLWWHSHAYATVYFSGTDYRTINSFGNFYSEWWLHLVVNKHREMLLRLDEYKPERSHLYIDNLKLSRAMTRSDLESLIKERRTRMAEIIKAKVKVVKG